MGTIEVFDIIFDNSHGEKYREGDNIAGYIRLVVKEEIKYKELLIELTGYVAVCWSTKEIDGGLKDFENLKGKSVEKRRFYYEAISLQCKGKDKSATDLILTPGEHAFPFVTKLPIELPGSFEYRLGHIRYFAIANLARYSNSCKVVKKQFIVENGLDLNFVPEAGVKIELCKYRRLRQSCFRDGGTLTIDWAVDRSGFVPGENILVSGSVQNDSSELVACSRVALVMVVRMRGKKRKGGERQEVASARKDETRPGEVTVWNDVIPVPLLLLPSNFGRVELLNISYELEFKVIMEGGMSPIVFTRDVYIGTVPVDRAQMESCTRGMFPNRLGLGCGEDQSPTHASRLSSPHHEQLTLADIVTAVSAECQPLIINPTAPCDDAYAPSAPDWPTLSPEEVPPYDPSWAATLPQQSLEQQQQQQQ